MNNKTYKIFTHNDLDGACSLLTFLWYHKNDTIIYDTVSNKSLDVKINDFLHRTINPKNVMVFDICLSEKLKIFDKSFITFVDHHKKSEDFIKKFTKSKIIYKDFSSTTRLLYKLYKNIYEKDLSDNQKKLILYCDDYDSGNCIHQESYDLNIIFRHEYDKDISGFISEYKDGWVNFSKDQIKYIVSKKIEAVKISKKYQLFSGEILFDKVKKKCLASFGDNPNIISIDYILNNNDFDIFFYINLETQKIIIKQKKSQQIVDIGMFARKYCDGNGHFLIAGGKITDIFMEIAKNFKPL